MIYNTQILTALHLSNVVYSDENIISFGSLQKIKTIFNKKTDTHGFVVADHINKTIYMCFRGTESKSNMITDLECLPKSTSFHNLPCSVHKGFLAAYESITSEINSVYIPSDYTIICCGHSLGGALATICAVDIPFQNEKYILSFGSPKTGDSKFVKIVNNYAKYLRIVHDNDIVPMALKINYEHAGKQIRLDDSGKQIQYFNLWKRLLYWIKGKKKLNLEIVSVKDHFMVSYIPSVTKWCESQPNFQF